MSYKSVEKHRWLNSSFFEKVLRDESKDDSIFVKTFEVSNEITKRSQSYWCDIIKTEINYTTSSNVAK